MAALETVGQYIEESRRLLQDEVSPYRYPDDDIVDALNFALLEARRLRADLFLPLFEVPWADPSGTIDTAALVTLDPMYRTSLIYYVVGRMQLRDDEPTVDQRAAGLLQKFTAQLLTVAG
jgi:hypothetical protein